MKFFIRFCPIWSLSVQLGPFLSILRLQFNTSILINCEFCSPIIFDSIFLTPFGPFPVFPLYRSLFLECCVWIDGFGFCIDTGRPQWSQDSDPKRETFGQRSSIWSWIERWKAKTERKDDSKLSKDRRKRWKSESYTETKVVH